MTRKQKKVLIRIIISGLLLAALVEDHVFQALGLVPALALYLTAYGIIGWDVLWRAVRNILNGQVFDENFLMAVATIGAFGCGEYPEGVAVMLFYQIGELFQSVAVAKSRRSIAGLMDIRPEYATMERSGRLVQVEPEEVAVGDKIVIRPGERVPLDGVVLEGTSALDTAALTGESLPRDVGVGDDIISGCVNLSGLLRVQVTRAFEDSTVARILELVENAAAKKARAEQFITKFARYYTPAVVFAALALAVIPPLLLGGNWEDWIHRALIFLVVSCPCALVISVPLSFFGGIGGASRHGILVKGGNYLEALARAEIMVFDKTGTLTQGSFAVVDVHPRDMTKEELLELAAQAEQFSGHPIAQSILAACPSHPDPDRVTSSEEFAGEGVRVTSSGQDIWVGNLRLMRRAAVLANDQPGGAGTVLHVALGRMYAGYITIADQIRPEAAQSLNALKSLGVGRTVMLTGDVWATAETIGGSLGIDQVHAQLLPGDKVAQVEHLLADKRTNEVLVYVGDGINDAPVLARADVGIAMGALGSDAAIEAADIVLMDDDLSKLPLAVSIARKTLAIVRENIVFALGIKLIVLALSAVGLADMWMAVFADVGVSVLAILNACRMLRVK